MAENSTLKIAVLISLAIHLLFLGLSSSLFQGPKIPRMPTRYVQVTLLPRVTKEKANAKTTLPVPLKVGNQDRDELPIDPEELHQAVLPPPPSVTNTISLEEAKPLSEKRGDEEMSREPMNSAMVPGTTLGADSTLRNEGNRVFSEEGTSYEGNLSVSSPASPSEEGGNVFSYGGSGAGLGLGTGYGSSSPNKGGPGKGTGILSESFQARRGSNGAQPKYAANPKPVYPKEAREKGYEGEVVLRVEVLANGRVGQIQIKKSSSYEVLDRSALASVKQWRFIPAKKGDAAIPLWVNIPIKFQLQ